MTTVVCPNCGNKISWEDYNTDYYVNYGHVRTFSCECGCRFKCSKIRNPRNHSDDGIIEPFGGYFIGGETQEEIEQNWERYNDRPVDERTFYIGYGNERRMEPYGVAMNRICNIPYEAVAKLYPESKDMNIGDARSVVLDTEIYDREHPGYRSSPSINIYRVSNTKPGRRFFRR